MLRPCNCDMAKIQCKHRTIVDIAVVVETITTAKPEQYYERLINNYSNINGHCVFQLEAFCFVQNTKEFHPKANTCGSSFFFVVIVEWNGMRKLSGDRNNGKKKLCSQSRCKINFCQLVYVCMCRFNVYKRLRVIN